jgi:hypothetical protein
VSKWAVYLLAFGVAVFLGSMWEREHIAKLEADKRIKLWQDSTHVAVIAADMAERSFNDLKAVYYRQRPAVIQVTKWKSKVDTVLQQITIAGNAGDSARAVAVGAIVDSLVTDCQARDSVARAAMQAATAALSAKDSAITLLQHPPKPPGARRIGYLAEGAYDPINHGVFAAAGVQLLLGDIHPFVQVGATIAKQPTGQVLLGVRAEF